MERWPPPNEPEAFESLCLDLWKEIWGRDSGAQKNGRSGQPQAGVDVFGLYIGRWVGVQCKQKDGLLRRFLSVAELNDEVSAAFGFEPALSLFIVTTTGPRDAKVQKRARALTEEHATRGLFRVEVWSWDDIWPEIHGREQLLRRILPIYWPQSAAIFNFPEPIAPRVAPSKLRSTSAHLFGREEELRWLDDAWADPTTHVVTLVAWGGVGKTALVAMWAAGLQARDYDGADYFDWSFYSQGTREQGAASGDAFMAAALRHFGDEEMAGSPASPWDKGARLAKLVAERRTLLVLDGLEPLQYPPGPLAGQLRDPAITALLKGSAARNPGLCVVTTRESVTDLAATRESTTPERKLERLSKGAGVELLKSYGLSGSKADFESLVEEVEAHALTLNLFGSFLRDAYGGDVRKRDRVELAEADKEIQGGHAFRVIAAYEAWLVEANRRLGGEGTGARALAILRLLGLFDRPATADCIGALRRPPAIPGLTDPLFDRTRGWRNWLRRPQPIDEQSWNLALSRLVHCGLISSLAASPSPDAESRNEGALDAHPLVREYFAHQLRTHHLEAFRTGHGRLFDHLTQSTEYQPNTLEGLQPLYQAVAHGCLAGRQEEAVAKVYRDRVLRGTGSHGFFSTKKLGAMGADLGAVACFFEPPWSRISPALAETVQGWLLNEAATRLRALGRLTEAREPMRAGLEMCVRQDNWKQAAAAASNLSELELTLGDVPVAVRDAEQAVSLADRSGDAFERIDDCTFEADALHQAGREAKSLELFREAERMQVELRPQLSLLYSLRGFRYCDLLLAESERKAWQHAAESESVDRLLARIREVEERAKRTLSLAREVGDLISIALDQLTLGRASLYRGVLRRASPPYPASDLLEAVDRLRWAGDLTHLPRGLLTRAWFLFLNRDPEGAAADLAEAQEIAERGPMPLFLADVHLHRARLFHDKTELAKARTLIDKHGYGRRRGELEDAEKAAKGW